MTTTQKAIQNYQRKVRNRYMESAKQQAKCEDVIRGILADHPEEGAKNLRMLNDYQALISPEQFEVFEKICINQITDPLF